MSKYINLTETNKLIRRTLKEAFPTVKFSVRGKSYSGGSSTDISWTDGPTVDQAKSYVNRFSGATFDGMIDLKSSLHVLFDGEKTSFGPDYIFYNRDYSDENVRRSAAAFRAQRGLDPISIDELIANEYNYKYCENLGLETSFIRKYMSKRSRVMGEASPTAERVQPWIDPEVAKQEQLEAQIRENRLQFDKSIAKYPWPLAGAMAAAHLAAGLARVQAIRNTSFTGGGIGTTPSSAGTVPTVNNNPVQPINISINKSN